MAASVLKFEFKVVGATKEDCIETLEGIVQDVLTKEGGEPWVTVEESYTKTMMDQAVALSGDPGGFFWIGVRTVLFTGPTKLGKGLPAFRDGFRLQHDNESDEPGLY